MKRRNVECIALVLALLMSLASVSAFAAPAEEKAPLLMENVTINDFDSTYYNDGGVVINNFGIVYNNGGTVYNNGGTVYNNEGTVYNNGGIVFNNGAQVYNNGGTVYNNDGGIVHETGLVDPAAAEEAAAAPSADEAAEGEVSVAVQLPEEESEEADANVLPVIENPQETEAVSGSENEAAAPETGESGEEPDITGAYVIELAADYSALAEIQGLTELPDGSYVIKEGAEASIRAKEGLVLTHAITTTGTCSSDNMGTITLANVDRDGRLTLRFKAKAPHASLAPGSYDDEKYLSLSAEADGAKVFYTTDNNSSPQSGKEARGALKIDRSMVVRAVTLMEGAADSEVIELIYVFPEVEEPEFKSVRAGYKTVAAKPAVLINTGLDTVYVESVRLGGENADCFTISTEKGGRLASGQKNDSTWMIAPVEGLAAGEYEAEVIFTFASGDRISEDFEFTVKK